VLGTANTRYLRAQYGSVLAGVQMAPFPGPLVVARRGRAAVRACQLGVRLKAYMDHHFPFAQLQLHILHLPRAFDAQYLA